MIRKIIEYVIASIDLIFLICVVGFAEERPLLSFIFIVLFGALSFVICKMCKFDERYVESRKRG